MLNMIDYTEQLLAAYSRLPEQLEAARREPLPEEEEEPEHV